MLNQHWSQLTDQELDGVIVQVKADFPTAGEIMLAGILRSRGSLFREVD